MSGVWAEVDHELCMGIAMCRSVAPQAFSLGDNGKSSYVSSSGASLDDLREAEENCPVQAITVHEDEQG
jgi:ferredoxin